MKLDRKTSDGFIEGHMPLARSVLWSVRQYHDCGYYTAADLEQEAYIALTIAANRYMPGLGVNFSTYAYTFIRNHLLRIIRHVEIGKKYETSLTDESVLFNIADEEPICHNYSDDIPQDVLYKAMESLSQEERMILEEYVLHKKTFRDLALELGVHYSTVKRRYDKICSKLRNILINK